MGEVYPASGIKQKRQRRTRAEVAAIEEAIITLAHEMQPATVRGIFYQLEVRSLVEKTENGYDQTQYYVLKLRRAGRLPYHWIADNTRYRIKPDSYRSLAEAADFWRRSYRRSIWAEQPVYVEFWIEKDALAAAIAPVTEEYDVPLLVARGFSSDTFLYQSAEFIKEVGRPAYIYLLGDHDASGMKAHGAITRGLHRFTAGAVPLTFERLAVTPEQIAAWNLPTRPGKESSHSKDFAGPSVELDAIPMPRLRQMVRAAIEQHLDPDILQWTRITEQLERESINSVLSAWHQHGGNYAAD